MKKSAIFLVFALVGACNGDAKFQQEEPGTIGTTREPERELAATNPTRATPKCETFRHAT